jgi:CBS domain-containing protein
MKKVGDIMAKPVKTIQSDDTISKAAETMKNSRIGCLIVIDGLDPVGIITERDIAYKLVAEEKSAKTKVKEVMSKDLKTISEDRPLIDAAKLMAAHVIRRLPVIEKGNVVGIIAIEDIMQAERMDEDPNAYSFS